MIIPTVIYYLFGWPPGKFPGHGVPRFQLDIGMFPSWDYQGNRDLRGHPVRWIYNPFTTVPLSLQLVTHWMHIWGEVLKFHAPDSAFGQLSSFPCLPHSPCLQMALLLGGKVNIGCQNLASKISWNGAESNSLSEQAVERLAFILSIYFSLKQCTFIVLQFCRPEVWKQVLQG